MYEIALADIGMNIGIKQICRDANPTRGEGAN